MVHRVRIALIHAVAIAMQPIADAFARDWPDADIVNILDDSLPRDRGHAEHVPIHIYPRFAELVAYAQGIGATGIMFTCSAFGPAIEAAARAAAIPVLKPNEAMFEMALTRGRRIGMLSTFAPSNAPMEAEFRELVQRQGSDSTLATVTVTAARDALNSGDVEQHNHLLADAVAALGECDAIMLAQFSASRAVRAVQARVCVPVLTAPGCAVQALRTLLAPAHLVHPHDTTKAETS